MYSDERFEKIRINFLFDHPFLSVLALSIPLQAHDDTHEAFQTDGMRILINPDVCQTLDDEVLKYRYAHTLLHILLKHPFRKGERDQKLWNRSCDIVINLLLNDFSRVGERPDEEPLIANFHNKSVEEVYHILYKESSDGEEGEQAQTQDRYDLLPQDGDTAAALEHIDAVIVKAVGTAQKQGNLPASMSYAIHETITPKIDLQTLLYRYISESFFDKNVSFSHPNRRFVHQGLYLPGYVRQKNRLELIIALDRSMSISTQTFSRFLGIIDAVVALSSDYEIKVLPFDEKVYPQMMVTYDPMSQRPVMMMSKGNGGTDFEPLAHYINTYMINDNAQQAIMILSDGYFKITTPLRAPTLFLISEKGNLPLFTPYGDPFYFDL